MQLSVENQERLGARQVLAGPDEYTQTHASRQAKMFRMATADTIMNRTIAEQQMSPGLEAELERIRAAVSGHGRFFTGTA